MLAESQVMRSLFTTSFKRTLNSWQSLLGLLIEICLLLKKADVIVGNLPFKGRVKGKNNWPRMMAERQAYLHKPSW